MTRSLRSTAPDQKFTAKERDSESGLDYFGARYLSSAQGRFLSPDPGPWILNNPQYFNMYNYALNNPLRYADEEGETPQDRVKAAASYLGTPYASGGTTKNGMDCRGLVYRAFAADPDSNLDLNPNNFATNVGYHKDYSGVNYEQDIFESQGEYTTDLNTAQPGDAIFFARPGSKESHVGIVTNVKNGVIYFIHAPKPGQNVSAGQVRPGQNWGGKYAIGLGRTRATTNASSSGAQSWWQGFENWVNSFFMNHASTQNQSSNNNQQPHVTVKICWTDEHGKKVCQ